MVFYQRDELRLHLPGIVLHLRYTEDVEQFREGVNTIRPFGRRP